MYKGLVVFDVDGVIFMDIFLKKIAKSMGLKSYISILILGLKYYTNKISIEELLKEGYNLVRNFNAEKAQLIADKIKRVTNLKEAVKILHDNNYYISLVSSGIPNFILKRLCIDIKADHYSGLYVKVVNGNMNVDKIKVLPKDKITEEKLKELKLTWENVIAVADDPNNLALIKKSRIGIGFNPTIAIRKYSDIVIEGNDFLEIIPYIIPEENIPKEIRKSNYSWKRELYRKKIHLLGIALPFLAQIDKNSTILFLLIIVGIYSISESIRYFGFSSSPLSNITRKAKRHSENNGFIISPILLAAGIIFPVTFFSKNIYIPSSLIVCISDSISSLLGKRFGKITIPIFQKTLEGSGAYPSILL